MNIPGRVSEADGILVLAYAIPDTPLSELIDHLEPDDVPQYQATLPF